MHDERASGRVFPRHRCADVMRTDVFGIHLVEGQSGSNSIIHSLFLPPASSLPSDDGTSMESQDKKGERSDEGNDVKAEVYVVEESGIFQLGCGH